MNYPIYVYGSTSLRRESEDITKDYPGLEKLLKDMYETMYASEGVGLAAPQIGKNIRVFVVDASPMADEEPELENFCRTFINAHIYEYDGEPDYFEEGCLSVPGIREDVLRPTIIKMKYLDENFVAHDETFTGFAARVIQHEYDHLDGKLFVDRVSTLRKQLIRSKLEKISKGDFKSKFPCKLVK